MDAAGPTGHDRQVLFAVMAIKLEFATPGQVLEFLERCIETPGGPSLGGRMVDEGLLTPEQHEVLARMCEQATECCQGDVGRTLERLGGDRALRSCFGRLLHRDGGGRYTVDEALTLPHETGSHVTVEQPGRYSIVDEQGRGGQSRVYRARDEHVGRQVAFKELLEGGGGEDDQERVLRFVREARITGSLEHPSIIPIYEIGRRLDGRLYYTMRLVKGRTLADAIRECKRPADRLELLGRFEDVCQAVAYAHDRGIIHRDLKPENVMVGAFGETLVLDWGLARSVGAHEERHLGDLLTGLDADALKTAHGAIMGTPAYMSPEQARGDPDRINERSDVWGLGAVLYEILTGRPPMQGRSVVEILVALTQVPKIPPARSVCPEVPPELSAIAERALQPWPEMRYANAGEMAREISSYLAGGRVASYSYSAWEIARQLVSRHLAPCIVALVAIYAILGLGVHKHLEVRSETSRARIEAAQAQDFATSMVDEFSRDLVGVAGGVGARAEVVRAALAYLEANLPVETASIAEKHLVATTRIELGLALNDDNRLDEATDTLQRALALIDSLEPATVSDGLRMDQALACLKLGDLALARHQVDEAAQQYEKAQGLYQDRASTVPQDTFLLGRMAVMQTRFARIAVARGRLDEAVKHLRAALQSARSAAAREPSNPDLQHQVCSPVRPGRRDRVARAPPRGPRHPRGGPGRVPAPRGQVAPEGSLPGVPRAPPPHDGAVRRSHRHLSPAALRAARSLVVPLRDRRSQPGGRKVPPCHACRRRSRPPRAR